MGFDATLLEKVVTKAKDLPQEAKLDLILASIAIKYTQSNSVGYAKNGMMIGVGAGQQSRVDCVKLAGRKVSTWRSRFHPKVMALEFKKGVKRQDRFVRELDGVAISSDAFFPFRDSIDAAAKLGVKFIAQPGGSVADEDVIAACDQYG